MAADPPLHLLNYMPTNQKKSSIATPRAIAQGTPRQLETHRRGRGLPCHTTRMRDMLSRRQTCRSVTRRDTGPFGYLRCVLQSLLRSVTTSSHRDTNLKSFTFLAACHGLPRGVLWAEHALTPLHAVTRRKLKLHKC